MSTQTGRPGQTSPLAGPATTAEERCELTELLVSMCAHCLGHTEPGADVSAARAELLARPGWIAALHAGRCRACDEPFEAGTAIHAGDGGWIAECCAEDVDEPTPATHSCPGKCGRPVAAQYYACPNCWRRLPFALRQPISTWYRRDAVKHAAAMTAAREWFKQHLGVST